MLTELVRKLTTSRRRGDKVKREAAINASNDALTNERHHLAADWTRLAVVQDARILDKLSHAEIQRQQIVHELLVTEQRFCRDLFTVQWIHRELMAHATMWQPTIQESLEKSNSAADTKNIANSYAFNQRNSHNGNDDYALTEAQAAEQRRAFDRVFSDIWPLIGLHEHFRDTLQLAYRRSPAYPACVRPCRELADKVLPLFLQPYEEYCVNYHERVTALRKLMADNGRFKQTLVQVVGDRGQAGWTAEILLHKPMQRLSQYHMLFQKLKQTTPDTDADYAAAVRMTGMLQTILRHLDGLKAQLEMDELMQSLHTVEVCFKYAVSVDGRRKKCKVGREYRLLDGVGADADRRCARQQLFYRVYTDDDQKPGDKQKKKNKHKLDGSPVGAMVQRRLSLTKTKKQQSPTQPESTDTNANTSTAEPIQVFLLTDYLLIGRPVTGAERKKYPRTKWMMLHLPVPLHAVSARSVPHPNTHGDSSAKNEGGEVLQLTVGTEVYHLRTASGAPGNAQVITGFCEDLTRCKRDITTDAESPVKTTTRATDDGSPHRVQQRPLSSAASSFTSKVLRRSSLIEHQPAMSSHRHSADHLLFQSFLDTSDMELCLETPCKVYYWNAIEAGDGQGQGQWVSLGQCRAEIHEANVYSTTNGHQSAPPSPILNAVPARAAAHGAEHPASAAITAPQIGFLRIHRGLDADADVENDSALPPVFTCKLAPYTRVKFDQNRASAEAEDEDAVVIVTDDEQQQHPNNNRSKDDFKVSIVMTQCFDDDGTGDNEQAAADHGPIQRPVVLRITDPALAREFEHRLLRFLQVDRADQCRVDAGSTVDGGDDGALVDFGFTDFERVAETHLGMLSSLDALNRAVTEEHQAASELEIVHRAELESEKRAVVVQVGGAGDADGMMTSLDEIELQMHVDARGDQDQDHRHGEQQQQQTAMTAVRVPMPQQPVLVEYPVMHVRKLGQTRHVYADDPECAKNDDEPEKQPDQQPGAQTSTEEQADEQMTRGLVYDLIDGALNACQLDALVFADEGGKAEEAGADEAAKVDQEDEDVGDVTERDNSNDHGEDDAEYQLMLEQDAENEDEAAPLLPSRDSSLCEHHQPHHHHHHHHAPSIPGTAKTQGMEMSHPFELNQVQLWVDAAIDDAAGLYDQLKAVQSLARCQLAVSDSAPTSLFLRTVEEKEDGGEKTRGDDVLAHQFGFDLLDACWQVFERKLSDTTRETESTVAETAGKGEYKELDDALQTSHVTLQLLRAEMDRMHRQVGRLETLLMQSASQHATANMQDDSPE